MSYRRCLWIAVGALYLPQLLPPIVGPLRDHAHCMEAYAQSFVIIPAFFAMRMLLPQTPFEWVLAVVVPLATVIGLSTALFVRPRLGWILALLVALASGFQSWGFAHLLRA